MKLMNKKGIFAAAAVLLLAAALFVGAGAAAETHSVSTDVQLATLISGDTATVGPGDTIILQNDIGDLAGISVKSGKNFTLDLNNHSLTFTHTPTGSTGTENQCFQFLQNSTIVIKNGSIVVDPADGQKFRFVIQNYANLSLTDVTVDGSNLNGDDRSDAYAVSTNHGNVTFDGDTSIMASTVPSLENSVAFDVCKFSNYEAPSVTVDTTGTITGKVEISKSNSASGSGVPTLKIENGTIDGNLVIDQAVAKDAKVYVAPTATVPGTWNQNFVAVYNDAKYTTLEAAVEAAKVDGGTSAKTITVLKDSVGNGIDLTKEDAVTDTFVIDFQGHSYRFQGQMVGSSGTETNGFRIFIGNSVTLKNGKLLNGQTYTTGNTPAKAMVNSYGTLNLENMTVDARTTAAAPSGSPFGVAALYCSNGPVNITGNGEYIANLTGSVGSGTEDCYVIWADNVISPNYSGPEILFDNNFVGTVTGNIKDKNANPSGEDKLTINAGVFNINKIEEPAEEAQKLTLALNGGIFNSDNADTKTRLEGAVTTEGKDKVKINGQNAKTVEIVLNADEFFVLTIPAKFTFNAQLESTGDVKLTDVLVTDEHAIDVTMTSANWADGKFWLKDAAGHETDYNAKAGDTPISQGEKVIDGFYPESEGVYYKTAEMTFTATKPKVAGNYNDTLTFTGSIVTRA